MNRRSSFPRLTATIATIAVLLTACSSDADSEASGEPASAVPDTTPTTSEAAVTVPGPTGWTPVTDDLEGILPAGRYGLVAIGAPDQPWAVVEVPDGFATLGEGSLFDEDPHGGGGMGYWTLSGVHRDPCEVGDAVETSTVERAAAAFQRQQRTRTSAPVPVTLDGHRGVYLEMEVPRSVDFAECPEYHLWASDPDGGKYAQEPGLERVWLFEVEGQVVVLHVTTPLRVPGPARQQLTGMVESVRFVRWPAAEVGRVLPHPLRAELGGPRGR